MKKSLLIIAIITFGIAIFGNWKYIRQLRCKSALGEQNLISEIQLANKNKEWYEHQIENLNIFYRQQEEQIIQNTQNELDMLWRDYSFKINCLNAVHNITRQERQARFNEIDMQYRDIVNRINSRMDSDLQTLEAQIQADLAKLQRSQPAQQ